MGMFDTVFVKRSLINHLIEDEFKFHLTENSFEDNLEGNSLEEYYSFQTKSLENFLFEYYIEDDGNFYVQKNLYSNQWLGAKEVPKNLQKVKEDITADVYFYDCFNTSTEYIYLKFKAVIFKGVVNSIELQSVERESLKQLKEDNEKVQLYWKSVERQWQVKIARLMQSVSEIFQKIIARRYNNIIKSLLDKGYSKHSHLLPKK
jgi:hypothetical protein